MLALCDTKTAAPPPLESVELAKMQLSKVAAASRMKTRLSLPRVSVKPRMIVSLVSPLLEKINARDRFWQSMTVAAGPRVLLNARARPKKRRFVLRGPK